MTSSNSVPPTKANRVPVGAGSRSTRLRTWIAWTVGFVVIFFILLVSRREVIFLPPFEDQAMGLWLEANYLVENNFDFWSLRFEEAHFNEPGHGARSYMVSVLPTMQALLLKAAPSNRSAIVLSHLAQIACGSAILLIVFFVLKIKVGVIGALLSIAGLLTLPLFVVQIDMLGMDVPTTLFSLWCALFVWQQRYKWAAVASTLAFLMKPNGALLTMATIAWLVLRRLTEDRESEDAEQKRLRSGLRINALALLTQIIIFIWGDPLPELRQDIYRPQIFSLPYVFTWLPDLGVLLGFAFLTSAAAAIPWLRRTYQGQSRTASTWRRWRETVARGMSVEAEAVFCWLVILGLLASMTRWVAIPRYFFCATPFLFIVLGLVCFRRERWRRAGGVAMLSLIACNLANLSDGRFYPDIDHVDPSFFELQSFTDQRSCAFTERSREYLRVQRGDIEATRLLEREHAATPILAPDPYRTLLETPRLGYVSRPLRCYGASDPAVVVESLRTLVGDTATDPSAPQDVILIWSNVTRATLPPPATGDEVLFEQLEPAPLVLYRKSLADLPTESDEIQQWVLEQTFPGPYLAQRSLMRMPYLIEHGRVQQAIHELQFAMAQQGPANHMSELLVGNIYNLYIRAWEALFFDASIRALPESHPQDRFPTVRAINPALAAALEGLDDYFTPETTVTEAETRESTAAVDIDPTQTYEAAIDELKHYKIEAATDHLIRAVADEIDLEQTSLSWFALGYVWSRQGRLRLAEDAFRSALRLRPEFPEAQHSLGVLLAHLGRTDEGIESLQSGLAVAPLASATHTQLATLLARQGEADLARHHFAAAIRLNPHDMLARQRLDETYYVLPFDPEPPPISEFADLP